jgi:hypothetical protein
MTTLGHISSLWRRWKLVILQLLVFVEILVSSAIQCFDVKYLESVTPTVFKYMPTNRRSSLKGNFIENDYPPNDFTNSTTNIIMTVPIFPLRKKVRLPTEELQLNLYEERYIQLAEYVRMQKSRNNATIMNFGAIFTSDKPQLVTGRGYGPVVPILQPGDVGVLFIVSDWIERASYRKPEQRVIQMNSVGGIRFRICNIISNGSQTINDSLTSTSSQGDNLPFILATVRLFLGESSNITRQRAGQSDRQLLVPSKRFGFVKKFMSFLGFETTSMNSPDKNAYHEAISLEQIRLLANNTVTLIKCELENGCVQGEYDERIRSLVEQELLFFAKEAIPISDVDSTMRVKLLQNSD